MFGAVRHELFKVFVDTTGAFLLRPRRTLTRSGEPKNHLPLIPAQPMCGRVCLDAGTFVMQILELRGQLLVFGYVFDGKGFSGISYPVSVTQFLQKRPYGELASCRVGSPWWGSIRESVMSRGRRDSVRAWREHPARWSASGLSVRVFCEQQVGAETSVLVSLAVVGGQKDGRGMPR